MNRQKKWLLSLLAMLPAAVLWDWIRLPFRNPHHILGALSQAGFNPSNNLVRFAVFVSLPSLTWICLGANPYRPGGSREEKLPSWVLPAVAALGFSWAILLAMTRFSGGVGRFAIDLFHDGDFLAPALKWVTSGHLWTTSYLTRGAFNDVFTPYLGWIIFGHQTIGAFKAFELITIVSVPLALWLLIYTIQRSLRKEASGLERALLMASLFTMLYLSHEHLTRYISRGWPVLLSLSALATAFGTRKRAWYFVSGLLATLALLTSSEVGVYVLAAEAMAIGFFALGLSCEVLPWGAGVAAGHLATLCWFGGPEYAAWLGQIFDASTRWDLVYAKIYPSPLHLDSWSTHGWPLVLQACLLLGFTALAPSYRSTGSVRGKIHLLLVAIALFSFRTALGRGDQHHLKIALGYSCLAAGFSLWLLLRLIPTRGRRFAALTLLVMPLLYCFLFSELRVTAAIPHFARALSRLGPFVSAPDLRFLTSDEALVLTELEKTVGQGSCAFTFANEPSWYYLLRKPNCGRFHFTVHAMGDDFEAEVARDLSLARPRFILCSSPRAQVNVDGIPNTVRQPVLTAWIAEHYLPYKSVAGWEICQLRN